MCLIALAFRQFPDAPVLLLGNREEQYARPSEGPRVFPGIGASPAWMGGLDLQAGGTWLGVNERALVVAVTNRRKSRVPAETPSRGTLCRRLLAESNAGSAVKVALRELHAATYAGCNLLLCDQERAFVIEAGDDQRIIELGPGLHLLTNSELDTTSDLRIVRARAEFTRMAAESAADWLRGAETICRLTAGTDEPPLCLVGPDRGTVSSTILGIGQRPGTSLYRHAQGSPLTTQHLDYSAQFNELLGLPRASANVAPATRQTSEFLPADAALLVGQVYRILLRGPWRASPLAQVRPGAGPGEPWTWSDTNLPASRTVRLPAAWQDLFGEFRGRVRFERRFHPPSNIGAGDALYLALTQFGGTGVVSLNGKRLGEFSPGYLSARFDVTGRLTANNEVMIDLECTAPPGASGLAGLSEPVALEIVSADAVS